MTPPSTSWVLVLLILLGAIAVLVVAGMIYGRRLANERHRAEEAAEERAEEAGVPLPDEDDTLAADTLTAPVAKQPDPDLPVDAPGTSVAPAPSPARRAAPAPQPAPMPVPAEDMPSSPPPPKDSPAEAVSPAAHAPVAAPDLAGALALTTIKGLGPKVAAMLAERGITRVDQIAALDDAAARDLDAQLGAFTGRMTRDRWVDQAKLLARGDTAAYEAEFGKLG